MGINFVLEMPNMNSLASVVFLCLVVLILQRMQDIYLKLLFPLVQTIPMHLVAFNLNVILCSSLEKLYRTMRIVPRFELILLQLCDDDDDDDDGVGNR